MKAVLKKWWLLIAVMAVILAIFIPFMMGYRLAPGLSVVQVGTLLVKGLPEGASIYIDNAYSRQAFGDSHLPLIPGSHTVIVSVPGYQPWNEVVAIESGKTTSVVPIFVSTDLVVRPIPVAEQAGARSLIRSQVLPTAADPLVLEEDCVAISVNANRILADAATDTCAVDYLCTDGTCGATVIFAPTEPIQTVIKFPGREDALIVSVGQSLFVLEIDPREPQFFAPILRLPAPRAAVWSSASIAVMSDTEVFEVPL